MEPAPPRAGSTVHGRSAARPLGCCACRPPRRCASSSGPAPEDLAGRAFLAAGTALALPFLLAPFFVPTLTALQRSRFESLLGVAIPADLRPDRAAWLRRLAYHGLCAPAIALGAVAVLATWPAALLALSAPGWLRYAPGDHSWGAGKGYVIVASASILGVWAAGALAGLLVHADRLAAQTLLGPDRVRALAERVETLAESRAEVVDAADAERRRIERDLHDGAQQRLVSSP
ncbi:hypothetical protein ACFQZC_26900 [Streptacidiphilus monticola]